MFSLDYKSPFRLGFCVFVSMPSSAGGPWAGVRRLIGSRAMRRLEVHERTRVATCAKRFLRSEGMAVAFQKDAWNNLRSGKDPVYNLAAARKERLRGSLGEGTGIPLFGVPPTRLLGASRNVLHRITLQNVKDQSITGSTLDS